MSELMQIKRKIENSKLRLQAHLENYDFELKTKTKLLLKSSIFEYLKNVSVLLN